MARVSLIERHEWGAKPPVRGGYPRHPGKPNRITIHHVGGLTADHWQGSKIPLAIQRIHQADVKDDGRGWPDAGYHILLDPMGGAWRMNDYWLRTNHAGIAGWDNNSNNIGVSIYGNFDKGDVLTQATRETLVRLLADICEGFDIDPMGSWQHPKDGQYRPNIMGHRDNPGVTKTCPGRNIHDLLPGIRRDVQAEMENARAITLSESLTKPITVTNIPASALRAQVEVGASATPILAIIAIILIIVRMRERKE